MAMLRKLAAARCDVFLSHGVRVRDGPGKPRHPIKRADSKDDGISIHLDYRSLLFVLALTFISSAFFLAACAVVALLVFPAGRDAVWLHAKRAATRGCASLKDSLQSGLGSGGRRWQQVRHRGLGNVAACGRQAVWLALIVASVVLPAGAILFFGLAPKLHLLDATSSDSESMVAQLLEGEQLVPPPTLPPEVFVLAETAQDRPRLSSADRKWELLAPDFRQRLLLVFKIMSEQHGYEMVLLEGYRSPQRQALLQALGPHVTHSGPYQSFHQYGLAADSAFLRNGRIVITEKDPWAMRGYELYGQVAESVGLRWGGRWTLRDFGHVEFGKRGPSHESPP